MTATHSRSPELALAPTVALGDLRPEIDRLGVQRAARELLLALGADVDSTGLKDTRTRRDGSPTRTSSCTGGTRGAALPLEPPTRRTASA